MVEREPEIHSVAAITHGRVLMRRAAEARGIIIGFHGYLETAAIQLARLESIPGADRWNLLSVQGLHRVYRGRTKDVVASWMTSQDREAAIADNVAYAAAALSVATLEPPAAVVYAGFSQGGAMAFRAALHGNAAGGIISVGADVPPELLADPSATFPPVLFAHAEHDEWFTKERHDGDVASLVARGVDVTPLVYGGGHDWTPEVSEAAARWLERLG